MRGTLGFGIGIGITRILGSGDGVVTASIFNDSNIVITFSEAVQPATVTNIGDGTGSFELYNDTDAAWVAGVLSTSDNIQWTFNPTVDFTVGDSLTLYLKDTILTVVGSNPYNGPFEFNYKVVNRLPEMATFTIDATSVDANIGILTATGTDLDGHTLTFGISLTDDSSTVALWQNEAAWQGSGFDSGLPEGTDETVTLYCFAKDSVGGVSLVSISDTCAVSSPLVGHFDGSDASSMLTEYGGATAPSLDADTVGQVSDQTSNGYNWAKDFLPTLERPTYQTGVQNSLSAVEFNVASSDEYLRNTTPLFTDDGFTLYVGVKAATPSVASHIITQHTAQADVGRMTLGASSVGSTYAKAVFFFNNGSSVYFGTTSDVFDGAAHILMVQGDGAGNYAMSVDGGTEDTANLGAWVPLSTHTVIGGIADEASPQLLTAEYVGDILEVKPYPTTVHSTGEKAAEIAALKTKWGIT